MLVQKNRGPRFRGPRDLGATRRTGYSCTNARFASGPRGPWRYVKYTKNQVRMLIMVRIMRGTARSVKLGACRALAGVRAPGGAGARRRPEPGMHRRTDCSSVDAARCLYGTRGE